jgi:hypothetical protein
MEQDDINLGLEHFHDQFDFVHTRLISSGMSGHHTLPQFTYATFSGIRDYYGLVDHIAAALLPGGLILLQDSDIRIYDDQKQIVPDHAVDHPAYSWTSHYFRLIGQAARSRRGHMDAASLFEIWLKGHRAFKDCGANDVWMPIGRFYPSPSALFFEWL